MKSTPIPSFLNLIPAVPVVAEATVFTIEDCLFRGEIRLSGLVLANAFWAPTQDNPCGESNNLPNLTVSVIAASVAAMAPPLIKLSLPSFINWAP